ncbi:MAG: hypothetical protein WAK95_15600 [Desulfobacterales bacterium]
MNQRQGTAATGSIISAIGSYFLTFSGHPIWGLFAGVIAVPLGVLGMIFAASPRVRGGIVSLLSIVFGAIAVVISILGIIGVIIF